MRLWGGVSRAEEGRYRPGPVSEGTGEFWTAPEEAAVFLTGSRCGSSLDECLCLLWQSFSDSNSRRRTEGNQRSKRLKSLKLRVKGASKSSSVTRATSSGNGFATNLTPF